MAAPIGGETLDTPAGAYGKVCLVRKVKAKSLSRVQLFVSPWIVTYQAPLTMGFSRQDCWSGWPFPSPGDLPNPGIEPGSPALQADALPSEPPGKPLNVITLLKNNDILIWFKYDFSNALV